MLTLSNEREMDAQASEGMVYRLTARIERYGHHLTPKLVGKIHDILTDAINEDPTQTGNMTKAAKAILQRMERDQ